MEPATATADVSADPASARSDGVAVTVLIAAYRSADTIERAISSVLADAPADVEVVVVDDGSDDGTAQAVRRLADAEARIRLIALPENVGVSEARNHGLDAARGTWLTFLDADDRLLPGGLAALRRPTADPGVQVVVGQRVWTDGDRTWVARLYDTPDIREPGRKALVTHPGLLYYASMTGKLFHRSLLDGLRFHGRVLGDQPWTIRAMLRARDRVEVIADDVYEWTRPRPDEPSSTITALTRRSAARSAVSARLARDAYLAVVGEAATLPGPARKVIERGYAERLLRSDFAAVLRRAIEQRDEGTAELLDAVAELVTVMPAQALAPGDVVLRHILRPPWEGWSTLDGAARRAYWRVFVAGQRADRAMAVRLAGSRFLAPGVALARTTTRIYPTLSGPIVAAVQVLGDRLRQRRRR